MVRFMATQTVAFALLVAPVIAGSDKGLTYLALGDSIAFGFDPTLLPPFSPPPLPAPDKFIGYPERVALFEQLASKQEVNAACPGETSGSFLVLGAPDNGCQGFKAAVGLHTVYPGSSQKDFTVLELVNNKHINLVTLSIGGNDLLLLQQRCANPDPRVFAVCVQADLASASGTLAIYGGNLAAILGNIRLNYQGTLILMKSYSPSVDPLFKQAILALNQVMVTVGTHFGVKFADGFTAFQIASLPFQGDPCKAHLLIHLSKPTDPLVCDVHPSPFGRDVLAATVLLAIGKNQQGNNDQQGNNNQDQ